MRSTFAPLRLVAFLVVLTLATPRAAHAFTYGSAVSPACHEEITSAALRFVRAELPAAGPIVSTSDEQALIDDVPFDLDPDMAELAAVSLLLGVRDNDLKGRSGTELDQLAIVHGDPGAQREHCLRPPGALEPDGSAAALRDCRAFILEKLAEALDGLDPNGVPDPNARLALPIDLELRGSVDAQLPIFWVRVGQALHALQDAYSHTFRTADGAKVTVVLDWIAMVEGAHDEARNGPAHQRLLDRCDEQDPIHQRNRRLATEASIAVLRTLLNPARDREAKLAEVDALVSRFLAYEPGCTAANRWCDAPENAFADSGACACAIPGAAHAIPSLVPVTLVGAAAILACLRRRRLAGAVLGAGLLLLARPALADSAPAPVLPASAPAASSPSTPSSPGPSAEPSVNDPAVVAPVEEERLHKERVHQASTFALAGTFAGGFVDPGIAGALGARLRLSEGWSVGIDGEANAWYGVQTSTMKLGSINAYASLIARWPMRFEPLNLRSTVQLGTAVQMLDLYGVPRGNVGLFVGVQPLGIEWKVTGPLYVVMNPLGVAIPATQLGGAPFAYTQFRSTIGVELGL